MPLIAVVVTAYAAGLLLGFGGFVVVGMAVVVALAIAAATRRSLAALAAAVVLGAGLAMARAELRHETGCRASLAARGTWTVVLDDPAAPGAFVRGRARDDGCDVAVSLSVARGRGDGGDVVRVVGSGSPSARGLTIKRAALEPTADRSLWRALRASAARNIDRRFGADAPMARALLVADARSIDPSLRDRFADAGIVHMLSISGLHVGIIAFAVQLLFQALRLPRATCTVGTILLTALYVLVIGAPPPALRSGVMLGVGAVTRLTQRPTSPWAALALGAAVPLASARTVLDVGYQLSVVGIAGLIASAALGRRWIAPHLDGWRAAVVRVLLTSVVATAVTAPIVAWTFGRVSIVAPLTNLAAGPVVAVLQPALFLVLILSPLGALASLLADAVHPLLALFSGIAYAGASVPFATLSVAPTFIGALLAAGVMCCVVWACVSDFPSRPLTIALAGCTVMVWVPATPAAGGWLEMHVIDVGQGDAIALRTPRGRWVLVDAGRSWRGGDAGRATVIPYLRRRGGELAMFVLSHPHADHVGGARSIIRALQPGSYLDGAYVGGSEPYRESLAEALDAGVRWRRVHPGDAVRVDGVTLTVLAPDSGWMRTLDDPNDASVVVRVELGAVRFLLMGDAERSEERWLLSNATAWLGADILKVGHHGSITSTTGDFLAAVRPRAAVVSVGAGNGYGHPSARVMAALVESGAEVLRTDQLGTIVVRTDGRRIEVHASGETWELSRGSSSR